MSSPHTHINIYNVETAVIFSSCAVRSHVARPKHRFSAMSAVVRTGPDLQYIQYNTVPHAPCPPRLDPDFMEQGSESDRRDVQIEHYLAYTSYSIFA